MATIAAQGLPADAGVARAPKAAVLVAIVLAGCAAAACAVALSLTSDHIRESEPASISMIVGFFGWVVAMIAAAYALRRAGASWPLTLLAGGAALFALHPPPVGPVGLVCLSAAVVLVVRWRAREAQEVSIARVAPRPATAPGSGAMP